MDIVELEKLIREKGEKSQFQLYTLQSLIIRLSGPPVTWQILGK